MKFSNTFSERLIIDSFTDLITVLSGGDITDIYIFNKFRVFF